MRTIRPQTPSRSTKSEIPDPSPPTEAFHTVTVEPDWRDPDVAGTFGVRWRVVSARTGKIAARGFFKSDNEAAVASVESVVMSGTVYSPKARLNLAVAMMDDVDANRESNDTPPYFCGRMSKCLEIVANTMFEDAPA